MKTNLEKIEINGITYIPESSQPKTTSNPEIWMVRTYSAGVFYGEIVKRDGKEVEMHNARRVWFWKGAASLSQLAQSGTSCPNECKFPEPVTTLILTEVIEMIRITDNALNSLNSVPIWKN
jgi:hypothetical protein